MLLDDVEGVLWMIIMVEGCCVEMVLKLLCIVVVVDLVVILGVVLDECGIVVVGVVFEGFVMEWWVYVLEDVLVWGGFMDWVWVVIVVMDWYGVEWLVVEVN